MGRLTRPAHLDSLEFAGGDIATVYADIPQQVIIEPQQPLTRLEAAHRQLHTIKKP